MESSFENAKIAVAIRTGRTALGWSQQEFANHMGVAKSTVARVETLEVGARADFMNRAIRLFKDHGVVVDLNQDEMPINISKMAVEYARNRLLDDSLRRSDKLSTSSSPLSSLTKPDEMLKGGLSHLSTKEQTGSSPLRDIAKKLEGKS